MGRVIFVRARRRPPTRAFRTTAVDVSNLTTYSFSSVDIGTAAADRTIAVFAAGRGNGAGRSVSSLSIGGNAANLAKSLVGSGDQCGALYTLNVASGATATISVTFSNSMLCAGVAVWALYGLSSATAVDTADSEGDASAMSIDVPADGILLAASSIILGASTASITGVTEEFDTAIEAAQNCYFAGGSYQATSAETGRAVTFDWTGSSVGVKSLAASFR